MSVQSASDGDVAISVESLSKSYLIGHEGAGRGSQESFREMLTCNARRLGRTVREMASGRQIIQGDQVEEFWALKGVSFKVRRGEVMGVIGRNGAGKSTLLKVLSRITEPTEGRVAIRGRVASLLEVGTGFHPELTGCENVFLNGAVLGMSRQEIKAKFDEIVAFAEVERFLDTPVKRYSSGMYVRLAFSVAAHLEPEILIVDEVLAVGDIEFQKKCLGKMQNVAGEGRTVLFVSHNLQAVERLCSRAIVLRTGRIVHDGTVGEACRSYLAEARSWDSLGRLTSRARKGSGEIRITNLEVLDTNGEPARIFPAGARTRIRIHYHAEERVRSPWFGLTLLSANGTRIFNTTSADCEDHAHEVYGTGIIEVVIDKLLLAQGHYMCNLAVSDSSGSYFDHLCEVDLLDVVDSDLLPGSRPYDQSSGFLYFPLRWSWEPPQ